MQVIACTGHRPNKLNNEYDGRGPLSNAIKHFMRKVIHTYSPVTIISGMALGADQLWAEVGVEMGVQVIAAVPFPGQEKVWPQKSQDRYWSILDHPAVQTHYVSQSPYRPELMHLRNQWMVDSCTLLLAVWNMSKGGTANCVRYARMRSVPIIYIDPGDLHV